MKRVASIIVKSLFAVLVSGGPFALNAQAQYDEGITTNIPFAFSADGHEIRASTYRLRLINNNFMMSLVDVKTGNEQFLTVRPETGRSLESSHGRLVFQVCDGRVSLTEVHIPGTNLFSETVNKRGSKGVEAAACSKENSMTIALR
jgi:hypothetical protein